MTFVLLLGVTGQQIEHMCVRHSARFAHVVSRPLLRLAAVGGGCDAEGMRDLDALIADIDQLEAEEAADDELRPLPGESVEEFKQRMLREFDELNALEQDGGVGTIAIWDAWRWYPEPEPEPEPEPFMEPVPSRRSYVIDPEDIHTVLPHGGPLSVSIGGRRLGTWNPAA